VQHDGFGSAVTKEFHHHCLWMNAFAVCVFSKWSMWCITGMLWLH